MTNREKTLCNRIIHLASMAAGGAGAGLNKTPMSDCLVITPIQLTMVVSLGKVFGFDIDQSAAKAEVNSALGATVGKSAAQVICSWIPGIGKIVNGVTAASITEVIGWNVVKEFEKNRVYL